MPIKATTKLAIIQFIIDNGFVPIDTTADENNQSWVLACPSHNGEYQFEARVDSLKPRKKIVCPECKRDEKIAKFEEKSNVIFNRDDHTVSCGVENCNLIYKYHGDFFTPFMCLCRSKRRMEHLLYRTLFEKYGILEREVLCPLAAGRHKADFFLVHGERQFYIECDDKSHFSAYDQRQIVDIEMTQEFVQKRSETEFLIRVADKALEPENLENSINTIHEYITSETPTPVLLITAGRTLNYAYLGIDDDVSTKVNFTVQRKRKIPAQNVEQEVNTEAYQK